VDSGAGISEDACRRAFEPLFSTKSFGVGLGLPLVRQIVEAHGGKVWLEPNPDCGATATIELPMNDQPR
jgi:signal transduction histidine kinase